MFTSYGINAFEARSDEAKPRRSETLHPLCPPSTDWRASVGRNRGGKTPFASPSLPWRAPRAATETNPEDQTLMLLICSIHYVDCVVTVGLTCSPVCVSEFCMSSSRSRSPIQLMLPRQAGWQFEDRWYDYESGPQDTKNWQSETWCVAAEPKKLTSAAKKDIKQMEDGTIDKLTMGKKGSLESTMKKTEQA